MKIGRDECFVGQGTTTEVGNPGSDTAADRAARRRHTPPQSRGSWPSWNVLMHDLDAHRLRGLQLDRLPRRAHQPVMQLLHELRIGPPRLEIPEARARLAS